MSLDISSSTSGANDNTTVDITTVIPVVRAVRY
jgi:hypothetical protein